MLLGLTLILVQGMNPILASAIMPGWGETILGKKNEARAFFIIEGSLWASYLGFNYFGHKIEYSTRSFAVKHAEANPTRRDEEYFDNLEIYYSSDDYNLEIERDASYYYPNDPERQQEYIKENSYFDDDEWQWDTLSSQIYYWQRRRAGREDLRRASFMTGFMLINRIVSIINVVVFSEQTKIGFDTNPGRIGIYYKF